MKAFHILCPALIALTGMLSEPMFLAPLSSAESGPEIPGKEGGQKSNPEKGASRPAGGPVLKITPIGTQNRNRIVVRIEIRNEGKEPIGWDSEFAAFMSWELSTDAVDEIKPTSVKALPTSANAKARFVKIPPGQKVSKDFELTISHRRLVWGSGLVSNPQGGTVIVPNGYEELVRFVIPEKAKSVGVEAVYTGIPAGEAAGSLFMAVGVTPWDAGLPHSRIRSGQIQIPLEPGAPPPRSNPVADENRSPATNPLQLDNRP